MMEQGYSANYIHCNFGINAELLKKLWARYRELGYLALIKMGNTKLPLQEKLNAIKDFEIKHLSLNEVLLKYGISDTAFRQWRRIYHTSGPDGLESLKIGRPSKNMGRPKKKSLQRANCYDKLIGL